MVTDLASILESFNLPTLRWNVEYDENLSLLIFKYFSTEGNTLSGSVQNDLYYLSRNAFVKAFDTQKDTFTLVAIVGYAHTMHMWDFNWETPYGKGKASYGIGHFQTTFIKANEKITNILNLTLIEKTVKHDEAFYNKPEEYEFIKNEVLEQLNAVK